MSAFDTAIAFVLEAEGGLSEDPNDPGGLTNYGISQRAYPHLDIRNLTVDQAKAIYHSDYWQAIRGDEFPPAVALALFDSAVNQGVGTAIRLLQHALGLTADGIIGPATLGAAVGKPARSTLVNFLAQRIMAYSHLEGWPIYAGNWTRRVLRLHQAALALA